MWDDFRKKLEVVLEACRKEHEYCTMEELREKVKFPEGLEQDELFKQVVEAACRYTIDTKSKHYMGKLYGGGSDASFMAETIIAYHNQNCHTYSSSPLFTFAEEEIIRKVIGYVGYEEGASGIFLPGGSYCTLVGMIAARYKKFPSSKRTGLMHPIQVITSTNSHYSIDKGAIMMGMGTDSVIKIDYDTTTPEEFEAIVVANNVFMINSTFGTTSEGFTENMDKFEKILKKYNIWHHIDACVGGVALFSTKYRHITSAFKKADSITVDCHKCLNLNQQCSLLLIKEGWVLADASRISAPYLFHKDKEHDIANRSFQCGRRGDGFKLWFCDKVDDLDVKATLIYDRNAKLKKIIAADPRFNTVLEHSLTHTCFRVASDKKVQIHEITASLRKEQIYVEYHTDYFRAVCVNDNIDEQVFKDVLDRIYETHQKLCE